MVSTSRRTLTRVALLLAAVVLLGLGTGFVLGVAGSGGRPDPIRRPVLADPGTSPTPSPSTPTTRADTDVEKGRRSDVGYALAARALADGTHVTFDRAQLLTGSAARTYAQQNKLRLPLSGALIVNDNRRVRDLVLSPDVKVYGALRLAGSTEAERIPVPDLLATLHAKGSTVPLDLRYDSLGYVVEVRERSTS